MEGGQITTFGHDASKRVKRTEELVQADLHLEGLLHQLCLVL